MKPDSRSNRPAAFERHFKTDQNGDTVHSADGLAFLRFRHHGPQGVQHPVASTRHRPALPGFSDDGDAPPTTRSFTTHAHDEADE